MLDHLVGLCSVSVEISVKSFQLFPEGPVDRLYQRVSSVLLSGTKFNLSLSISICVSFPQRCLQPSVNDKKSLQTVFSQSVKVAVLITTLFSGHWKGLFQTTHLNHWRTQSIQHLPTQLRLCRHVNI